MGDVEPECGKCANQKLSHQRGAIEKLGNKCRQKPARIVYSEIGKGQTDQQLTISLLASEFVLAAVFAREPEWAAEGGGKPAVFFFGAAFPIFLGG